jgi:hypothetical protein
VISADGRREARRSIREASVGSEVLALAQFGEQDFLPYVCTRFAEKPSTLTYYRIQVRHLISYNPLANAAIDAVTPETISGFVAKWRDADYQVSSINRAAS